MLQAQEFLLSYCVLETYVYFDYIGKVLVHLVSLYPSIVVMYAFDYYNHVLIYLLDISVSSRLFEFYICQKMSSLILSRYAFGFIC